MLLLLKTTKAELTLGEEAPPSPQGAEKPRTIDSLKEGPKDFEVPKAPSPGRPTPYDARAPPPLSEEAKLSGKTNSTSCLLFSRSWR